LADFKMRDVALVHRLGRLRSRTSVLIVVASAHRGPAFDACRWLIYNLSGPFPSGKRSTLSTEPFGPTANPSIGDCERAGRSRRLEASGGRKPRQGISLTCGYAFLLILLLSSGCLAQDDADGTVKVDVKLVNMFVTVTRRERCACRFAEKGDFKIIEDGTEQKISVFDRQSELPLSIVTAIDTSLTTGRI